jgi:hypothetical protein
VLLAGIRRDRSTSPKFQLPTASPPPPLAPRPDLVQLSALLHRNCSNPVPPLTGAAPRMTSPSTTHFHQFLGQIKYGNRTLISPWCSCAPWLPVFAGPSPGTPVPRHGRRPSSLPAVLRPCPSSTTPSNQLPTSRRSCQDNPSPPVTSPPVGTCRSRSAGHRRWLAGAHVQIDFLFQGPRRKKTKDPPPKWFCYFM